MKFDRVENAAVIALLAEWFPKAFFVYEQRRKPLKLRIDMDLQVALASTITPAELHRALRVYCGNEGYLRGLLKGAWRVDLAGNPVGAVPSSTSPLATSSPPTASEAWRVLPLISSSIPRSASGRPQSRQRC